MAPFHHRFYYGWIIVLTLAIAQMTSWGVLSYAFSVLLKPLQQEVQWDSATITGAFSLAILVSGIAAVPIGYWIDRDGARRIMTLGSTAGAILVVAWSQVVTPLGFYAIWFLMGIAMAMTLYDPAFAVIARWFDRKRSWALTILTVGGGLSSVVYVPLTGWFTLQHGWRPTLIVLAGMLAVGTIPFYALVLRRCPADLGLLADGAAAEAPSRSERSERESGIAARMAVRESAFWWLTAAFSFTTFMFTAITVHLMPYLTERGFPTAFAVTALGLVGGSQIPGRLLFAAAGSRLSRWLIIGVFGVQLAAIFILIALPTEIGVLIFAVSFGASAGASSPARAMLLADRYGSAHFGSINGILALIVTLARAAAPVSLGALSVALHGYQLMPWLLAVVAGSALIAILNVPVCTGLTR